MTFRYGLFAFLLLFICIGTAYAQGSNPTMTSSSFESTLYSSSLAFSKDMQFAVAVQDPHKSVYVYSLKGNGKNIATINGFASPRTVVFDENIPHRFYVADSTRGAVFIVDISEETYKITHTISVEKGIFGMVLDPKRKRLFVTNPTTGILHVIDLEKKGIILSAPGFKGVQQGIEINSSGTVLYLGSNTTRNIYIVDARTLNILETIEGVTGITDLQLNISGARLYVTSLTNNMVFVYSTATYKLLASIPTGSSPTSLTIPTGNTAIITSNTRDGTLSVISSLHMNVVRTIKLPSPATGAVVASKAKGSNDIVYTLDKSMNILVVNWPMGIVQKVIE